MAKKSFEGALKELEEVVQRLESEDLALDKSLELFEAGIKASRTCARILDRARKRVQKLIVEDDESFKVEPLEEA